MHPWREIGDRVFVRRYRFLDQTIGLVVGDGISVAWPLYTSLLRAKELIFTGDRIKIGRAHV